MAMGTSQSFPSRPVGWQDAQDHEASPPLLSPDLREQELCPCTLAWQQMLSVDTIFKTPDLQGDLKVCQSLGIVFNKSERQHRDIPSRDRR